MSERFRPRNADIPDSAGVYMFRDRDSRVIYVGKALSLRNRVPNYFTSGLNPRTASMVADAKSVEWIVTANEVEALQLEVTLIKEHRPRYNVRYRDDKSYPYLTITTSEEIPRAMVTRGKKKKGDRYFGPYTHAYAIRETLDLLLRVFPIRSCSKGVFDRARRSKRACLLYDIGRCSGPCVFAVSPDEHMQIVERFSAFMDGDHDAVVEELKAKMRSFSDSLEFEKAARARDQLAAVDKVIARQQMVSERAEDLDVIASAGDDLEASFQVFFVRGGRMVGRKGFIVDVVEDLSEGGLYESFIENLYADSTDIPRQIIVAHMPDDVRLLERWLTVRRGKKVSIRVPERGDKRALLQTVHENAKEGFAQSRLKRATDFASRSKALSALQEHLDLPEAPLRIECFDISNLGSTEVVGSMVVFEDALEKKADYRKFRVRTVDGQDDFAAIGEVIERRFTRFMDQAAAPREKGGRFAYTPGLVVIDGGKGQLNRAVEVMSRLGVVGIPVVSLAKRLEEVFVPGEKDPRIIPRGSEALYLLQRIRDEAHRFAVSYQRTRRGKMMTESLLDSLEGVGPTRRTALLKHFGSAGKVINATADEIADVPGIGPGLAGRIYEQINKSG